MTVAWSTTLTSNDSGDANYSFRVIFASSVLTASGSQVRITVNASTVAGLQVDHVSIGQQDLALSQYATAATPVEILFGGASGFNLSAGGTLVSDWATFTFDQTQSQVIIFDISSANGNPRIKSPIATGTFTYQKSNTDSWNVANPSGFSGIGWTYIVSQIEVQSGGGGGASVAASSGSIGISGKTGSASATANRTVKASAGSLGITGQIGHVIASDAKSVSANSGRIGVSGQGARVAATANVALHATDGSVSIAGQSATVSVTANQTVEVGAGSLGISGGVAAVSVTANQNVRAASGSISVSGQTPSVSVAANVSVAAQAGTVHIAGAGCRVQVTSSASVEANAGRLSIRGQVANVSTRSKSMGDDAGRRYSQWAPRGTRPIRVVYDEEDVREALGEPEAKAAPKPTKAKKRKLVKNVERKVLAAASLPEAFAPRIERAVAQEVGTAWHGPSDWEVLSAILNVAAQKAVEEIQRIQAEIEEEDEMILLLAA